MISCIRILSMIFLLFFGQGFFVSSHCHGSEADRSFTIQVLFGAIKDDASRCLKKLRKMGYEAYIFETTNEAGEKFYRVRIGQFKTEREARAYAVVLEKESINYWIVPITSLLDAGSNKKDPVSESNQTAVSSTLHNHKSMKAVKTDMAERPVSDKGLETEAMDNASVEVKAEAEESTKASDMDRFDNREKTITDKTTPAEEDWPSALSKVYKYYDQKRTLHVTNSFKKIPVQFRGSIKEVQMFPVRFISLDALQRVFNIEIDGEKKNIKLNEMRFVGNDRNDIECFPLVGYSVVPNDAFILAKRKADLILENYGGHGAVREI